MPRPLRRVLRHSPNLGIEVLTLYAFSADNWKRAAEEVSGLMELLDYFIRKEVEELRTSGVRLEFIGRRDRLRPNLVRQMEWAESETQGGQRLLLRIAVDYSSRK